MKFDNIINEVISSNDMTQSTNTPTPTTKKPSLWSASQIMIWLKNRNYPKDIWLKKQGDDVWHKPTVLTKMNGNYASPSKLKYLCKTYEADTVTTAKLCRKPTQQCPLCVKMAYEQEKDPRLAPL